MRWLKLAGFAGSMICESRWECCRLSKSPEPFKLSGRFPPARDTRMTDRGGPAAVGRDIRRINAPRMSEGTISSTQSLLALTASPVVITLWALRTELPAARSFTFTPRARAARRRGDCSHASRTTGASPAVPDPLACVRAATTPGCKLIRTTRRHVTDDAYNRRPRRAHFRSRGGQGGTAKPIAHGAQDPHPHVKNILLLEHAHPELSYRGRPPHPFDLQIANGPMKFLSSYRRRPAGWCLVRTYRYVSKARRVPGARI